MTLYYKESSKINPWKIFQSTTEAQIWCTPPQPINTPHSSSFKVESSSCFVPQISEYHPVSIWGKHWAADLILKVQTICKVRAPKAKCIKGNNKPVQGSQPPLLPTKQHVKWLREGREIGRKGGRGKRRKVGRKGKWSTGGPKAYGNAPQTFHRPSLHLIGELAAFASLNLA